jgi:hypothetical protein
MFETYAGFYCTPTQLAENADSERLYGTIMLICIAIFISVSVITIKKTNRLNSTKRISINIGLGLAGIIILISLFSLAFINAPHLCGN